MNHLLLFCFATTSLFFASIVHADIATLERQLNQLEEKVSRLSGRVHFLERGSHDEIRTEPVHACLIIDSGYQKTFLGLGQTSLEATAKARAGCGSAVHPSYCTIQPKCDHNRQNPEYSGFTCLIVDSGYSRTFSGNGRTAVEAEAKAKNACEANGIHPTYCGGVKATCEGVLR